jgi:mRNA interferase RelE/StbE
MKIVIFPRAEKQLRQAPKVDQISVAKKIRDLGARKPTAAEEKLKGFKNIYRVRIGDYRVVYKKTSKELYVILIGHRKDIYKILKRLLG